jgi:nucleotide-binding universal stress UspA family protein
VTLLHVLEGFPSESVYSGSRAFRLIEEYRALVGRTRSQLRSGVPADALNWCDVDTEVVSGIPREAIVAVAIARRADLIVVGVSPRTKLHRIVMGSTIAGVLRRTRCAVLTVPSRSSAAEVGSESISVCGDENEPATAVMSPATLSITHDMAIHTAEGGKW